ncbi:MAG: ROK family protein [Pirellulales bacterium]
MYLGIEIGGTKLQLGVGSGTGGPLVALQRCNVEATRGAEGIRQQIARAAKPLLDQHGVQRIGVGFGGPVDAAGGRVIKSFQIDGWDGYPLCDWCRNILGLPAVLENDSNLAGLGEARFGAGRHSRIVFYSNVGSGIGGALVIDGALYVGGAGAAVAEVGHLRPGPQAMGSDETVESFASGWGIAAQARARLADTRTQQQEAAVQLLAQCGGEIEQLTGKMVVQAAVEGNPLASEIFRGAIRTYGWALAQVVTLLAPNVLVIGGGVPQVGETLFLAPLRKEVERYVIPPLRGTYEIVPAALGEEVVLHGALALAAGNAPPSST